MSDIDPITGLPKELGAFEEIAKESQMIRVYTQKRKFGKLNTLIEGMDKRDINIRELAKRFKNSFATGGTVKGSVIELQGDFTKKVYQELIDMGYTEQNVKLQ